MESALLILLPFVLGLASFAFGNNQVKYYAFGVSLATFVTSVLLLFNFCSCGVMQYTMDIPWIPSLGIHFSVGMDGISMLLVMLTTFLVPLIILSSFRQEYHNPQLFYFLILTMQAALTGVFVARDAFLFYIFWELALIPIYFISLVWGGENRGKITFKFFIYTLFGSLFMLLGIIYLYLQTTPGSFDINAFYSVGPTLGVQTQSLIFWAFFIAFAIKMPIFPFHTWQPDTYTTSPTPGTMLLSGIMLKMGIYGVIRWLYPIVPQAFHEWSNLIMILSVTGIVYASVIALFQKDFKRLIAYVSIAHVGLIAAGVFSATEEGLQGAVIQMLAHGVNVVGLFFVLQIILDRTRTLDMASLGGIRGKAPVLSILFIIILLSSVALPLTGGFVGEFLLFVGVFHYSTWLAAVAGLTIVFGAVYMLSSFQKTMLGEPNAVTAEFKDLVFSEMAVLVPIAAVIFFVGIYPEPLLKLSEPAVKNLMEIAGKAMNK